MRAGIKKHGDIIRDELLNIGVVYTQGKQGGRDMVAQRFGRRWLHFPEEG